VDFSDLSPLKVIPVLSLGFSYKGELR